MSGSETIRQQGTRTRNQILKAIKDYIRSHGYPPTCREICDMTGIRSTSTVHNQLRRMFADGTLETDNPGTPRAIRIPGMIMYLREE